MTICRYFLQGTCRYGNRCRYEHVYPNQHSYGGGGGNYGSYRGSGGNYSSNYGYNETYSPSTGGHNSGGHSDRGGMSILRAKAAGTQFQQGNSIFGQANANPATQYSQGFFSANAASNIPNVTQQKPLNSQESKELLQMIINEFAIWEHSGLWPLSCFSLFKGQGCFPGLTDYSPEEIRWFMYQGRLAGNFEECQQFVKELINKSKLVKEQFMTPSGPILEILSRLLRGEKIELPPPSPLFPSIKLNAPGNAFGSNSAGNLASAARSITPLVPAPTTSAVSSFTFALPNNVQQNTNQTMGGFGVPQMSVFSNPAFNTTSTSNTGQSIFGGATQNQSMSQISSQTNDSVIYTPMSELTEETINAFNSPMYTMGSVPIKPPPKELCLMKR